MDCILSQTPFVSKANCLVSSNWVEVSFVYFQATITSRFHSLIICQPNTKSINQGDIIHLCSLTLEGI
jgi:hypothetical protein